MTDLLAGPIVRRTTENRVCVWLATRNKLTLKLTIMDADGDIGRSDLIDLEKSSCKLGNNLYVYLLQAYPIQNKTVNGLFPKDQILYYRIVQIEAENAETFIDLAQIGLTYGEDRHPSFIIADRIRRLLHGSCRKTHGLEALYSSSNDANLADGLSHGDDELAATHGDIETRPALLLMTGDQIYADEVPASVMEMIKQKVTDLMGYSEEIPAWPAFLHQAPKSWQQIAQASCQALLGNGDSAPLPVIAPIIPANIPPNERKRAVTQTGFTTDKGENHLLAFGEFAAMYLYVFGNAEAWTPLYAIESETENPGRKQAVEGFHASLQKVRRLLANVATYMIFDDHDVTDDWNITGYWYAKVRDTDTGRRVVANALAAYWAFQGWGNDLDKFDQDLKWVIEQFSNTAKPSVELGDRYDLQLWKYRGWGFSIPTNPPIIAIDSRTQRQPDIISNPPQLLDRYALDWLRLEWQKLKTRPNIAPEGLSWPIFIATTPVMGVAPVEGLLRLAIWLTGLAEGYSWVRVTEKLLGKEGFLAEKIIEKLDAEAWVSNPQGFVNFLATMAENMGIRQCVFLSGDVHYSFSANASFQRGKSARLNCLQLTSSPLCNSSGEKTERLLKKAGELEHGNTQHGAPPILHSTWKVDIHLLRYYENGKQDDNRIINHCNLGLLELRDGVPVSHRLLTGNSNLYFSLV